MTTMIGNQMNYSKKNIVPGVERFCGLPRHDALLFLFKLSVSSSILTRSLAHLSHLFFEN